MALPANAWRKFCRLWISVSDKCETWTLWLSCVGMAGWLVLLRVCQSDLLDAGGAATAEIR